MKKQISRRECCSNKHLIFSQKKLMRAPGPATSTEDFLSAIVGSMSSSLTRSSCFANVCCSLTFPLSHSFTFSSKNRVIVRQRCLATTENTTFLIVRLLSSRVTCIGTMRRSRTGDFAFLSAKWGWVGAVPAKIQAKHDVLVSEQACNQCHPWRHSQHYDADNGDSTKLCEKSKVTWMTSRLRINRWKQQ